MWRSGSGWPNEIAVPKTKGCAHEQSFTDTEHRTQNTAAKGFAKKKRRKKSVLHPESYITVV